MNDKRELLYRRMEEVATLPADDPLRQQVVEQIAEQAPELEDNWLELLREDEQLRLELRRVDIPAGLAETLMTIPESDHVSRSHRRLVLWSVSSLAAAVVIISVIWSVAMLGSVDVDQARQALATLAAKRHMDQPTLTVPTADAKLIETTFQNHLPYEVRMPQLDASFQLVGGAASTLDGQPVVYSRWTRGDQVYSLYQFCAADFSLPDELVRQALTCPNPAAPDRPCRVVIWTEDHCAYALVNEVSVPSPPPPAHTPA